jgi:antitoxin component YwqK of YwqJK toxin-antitoxin module/Flp pilus assembly protein TadD
MNKFLIAMLLVSNLGFSQEKIPYIDYDEILEKINKEESSEKKIALIAKISKNDSAYYPLLVSKSYHLLQIEKYEEALSVANEGIDHNHEHSKANYYINKGVALTNLKRDDEALENYLKGIQVYPKNYLLWSNKASVLERQGKLNDAVNAYKTAITLNPTYRKPHLQIGNIYYKQERLTQALMCFNMYLLLEPDANGAFTTLQSLNNVVQAKNSNKRDRNINLDDEDDSFEDIDLVLTSKLAMNKKYKTGNPINVALARQNHAMIAQLKNFEGNGGFWDKTYVPFYKWIAENNKYDDFIYTLTYSVENEEYKKIIEKNTKNIIAFLGDLKKEWTKKVSKNNILFNGKQQDVTYQYSDSYVDAIGVIEAEKTIGFWQFYNASGRLTTEGNFDAEGNRTGKWTWYTSLDKIKETAFYKEGLLEGPNLMFHKNGKKYVNAIYKNDFLHSKYESFNKQGALVQRKYFKLGSLDSIYKSYFKVGEKNLEFYIPYKNGEIEGETLEYYENGDLYEKTFYISGKRNGVKTKYHYNKKTSSEINYLDGELSGSYKSYHTNGKLNEVGQSLEGFYNGPWKLYYSDGTLQSEFSYEKGNLNDLYKFYDTDGKLFYEYVYKKGELIAFTFYNKDATVLKKGKKKSGAFYYEGFSPKGNKTTEGLYDISGGKMGEWKFYTNHGVLTNKGNYIEGKAIGAYFTYFKNGKIDNITTYKEDVIDGYYMGNHVNGQISTQGWYKEGKQHGEWIYYNLEGTINVINYYHKGLLHGVQKYYGVAGKLTSTSFYKFDHLISEKSFEKEEVLFEKLSFTSVEEEYEVVSKHFNGKPKISISYVNEVKHGDYEVFYFNGNKKVSGIYINGAQSGLWTWYYENGNIESKTNYYRGNINGKIINYYKNGNVQGDYNYENDLEVGTSFKYYKTGTKKSSVQYYEGKKHGRQTFYDVTGQLQIIRFYAHGAIIGYSYTGKNGTEIAMIPVSNETGKVEAFFDTGKPSKTMEYKYGSLVNNYKSFFYNGAVEEEMFFVDGEYHGAKKMYFLNGKLKEETTYLYGEKHGKNTTYYQNGNKKEEKMFSNDIEHGMSFFYDEAGKLKKKKDYFNGKIYTIENL